MTLWVASVSLYVGASLRTPLSVLARNPHKGLAPEISHETGMTSEERSQRQWAGDVSQEMDTVSRREQKRLVYRTGQSGDESRAERRPVNRSQYAAARTVDLQMPGWPRPEDKSSLLVAFWEFPLEYTLALAHRMHKKCHRLPLLRLDLNQVRVCLFFSFTLSVVFCVFVKECEISLARDEKNHKTILMAMRSLFGWDSGGRPAGIVTLNI